MTVTSEEEDLELAQVLFDAWLDSHFKTTTERRAFLKILLDKIREELTPGTPNRPGSPSASQTPRPQEAIL